MIVKNIFSSDIDLIVSCRTYVTGGTGLGGPYSSIDEAYHYYGMKNPLEVPDVGMAYCYIYNKK